MRTLFVDKQKRFAAMSALNAQDFRLDLQPEQAGVQVGRSQLVVGLLALEELVDQLDHNLNVLQTQILAIYRY
jgi:hypothetical protein